MVTVSQVVKRYVDSHPVVHESLVQGIVNYSSLAEKLHEGIEKEMGGKVKRAAIIMALRRHAERSRSKARVKSPVEVSPEIIIKTNLCTVSISTYIKVV